MSTVIRTADQVRDFVDQHLHDVARTLSRHIDQAARELPEGGGDYRDLWHSVGIQLERGKRLRPSLTLAAYGGLGGDDAAAVVPVAAAMEMLHTAMVIHDDVLDHDEVRRGQANVAGMRRAALEGRPVTPRKIDDHVMAAALLAGDLALTSAYALVAEAELPAHHRLACLRLVTRAARATVAGELLDMYADEQAPEEADSLVIAQLKTATYSVVVPLLAGAQLGGADPTLGSHLERLGAALGLSFQLIDDDLGVFGDPTITGKSVLSDLRAGKRTELLRAGFTRADAAGRSLLSELVGRPDLDDAGAARVREVLVESGAREQTLRTARQQARIARRIASERIAAPLSEYLIDLIDTLGERTA